MGEVMLRGIRASAATESSTFFDDLRTDGDDSAAGAGEGAEVREGGVFQQGDVREDDSLKRDSVEKERTLSPALSLITGRGRAYGGFVQYVKVEACGV
jgi:hypothetical protein